MKTNKFKRKKAQDLSLNYRDIEILKLVYRFRFLTTAHIQTYFNLKNRQTINPRLRLLFDNKYLDRPIHQVNNYKVGSGSNPLVYCVGNEGAKYLSSMAGFYFPKSGYQTEKNRKVKSFFIEHSLEIAEFFISIERFCLEHKNIRFINQEEILSLAPIKTIKKGSGYKWAVSVRWEGIREDFNLIPDGIFGLEFLDRPEGKNKIYFFYEADRGTMPLTRKDLKQTSFLRKLLSYQDTHDKGLALEHFGITNFRVLTVTTSNERVTNLVNVCDRFLSEVSPNMFLFHKHTFDKNPLSSFWKNAKNQPVKLFPDEIEREVLAD